MLWRKCTSPEADSTDKACCDSASCERRMPRLDDDFFDF